MPITFKWSLSLIENVGLADGANRVIAFNWHLLDAIDSATNKTAATPQMAPLLMPWEWTNNVSWTLYKEDPAGTFSPYVPPVAIVPRLGQPVNAHDIDLLQAAVKREFEQSWGLLAANAFSLEAKYALPDPRSNAISLVAVSAGLCHAPAAIAGGMLNFSGHLLVTYDAANLAGTYVLVPTIGTTSGVCAITTVVANGSQVACTYAADNDGNFIEFVTKPFVVVENPATVTFAGVGQGIDAAFVARAADWLGVPRLVEKFLLRHYYETCDPQEVFALQRRCVALMLGVLVQALDPFPTGSKPRTLFDDALSPDSKAADLKLLVGKVQNVVVGHIANLGAPLQPPANPGAPDTIAFLTALESKSDRKLPLALSEAFALSLYVTINETALLAELAAKQPKVGSSETLASARKWLTRTLGVVGPIDAIAREDSAHAFAAFLVAVFDVTNNVIDSENAKRLFERQAVLLERAARNGLGHREDPPSVLGMLLATTAVTNMQKLDTALVARKKSINAIPDIVWQTNDHGQVMPGPNAADWQSMADQLAAPLNLGNALPLTRHDVGLEITLPRALGSDDAKQRMGYAVALGHGIAEKPAGATWITKTQSRTSKSDTKNYLDDNNAELWIHDALRMGRSQGIEQSLTVYRGEPAIALVGSAAEFPVMSPSMYRLWPESARDELPIFGYGITYTYLPVRLDNAGGAEEKLAISELDIPTVLKDAQTTLNDATNSTQTKTFLSIERIGGPRLSFPDLQRASEVSEDSFAVLWNTQQRLSKAGIQPYDETSTPTVAVLAPQGGDLESGPFEVKGRSEYTVIMHAPQVRAAYLERWLNFEIVARELKLKNSHCDPRLNTVFDADLKNFTEKLRLEQPTKPGSKLKSFLHPGMTSFRVVADFGPNQLNRAERRDDLFGANGPQFWQALEKDLACPIKVKRGEQNALTPNDDGSFTLTLAPGAFVRLKFQVGIAKRYFESTPASDVARIDARVMAEGNVVNDAVFFDGATQWFESIDWPTILLAPIPEPLTLKTDKPDQLSAIAGPRFSGAGASAHLKRVSGLRLTTHNWHWVGPPINPEADLNRSAYEEWVQAYANVASQRSEDQPRLRAEFVTGTWLVQGEERGLMKSVDLPHLRGARHMAIAASSTARFRKWLKPSVIQEIEKPISVYGNFIQGRQLRSPLPPKWQLAVPLGETRDEMEGDSADLEATRRSANGVLVVFNEALFETDSLASGGGLAEAIDVDVVSTWQGHQLRNAQNDPTEKVSLAEFGPNPIFEPMPLQPARAKDTFMQASRPYGLTNDIGGNPLITRTAIVVRPPTTGEQWTLAKLRTRKFYWPHLLRDNSIESRGGGINLAADPEREMAAVSNFACYGAPEIKANGTFKKVSISIGQASVALYQPTQNQKIRILASMQKAKWSPIDVIATWRWQFSIYVVDRGNESTVRLVAKVPPQVTGNLLVLSAPLTITITGLADTTYYRFLASEYTIPRWVSFIGLLGASNALSAPASDYRLVVKDLAAKIDLKRIVRSVLVPETNIAITSPDDPTATCFQLLLMYRPARDALRGYKDDAAGIPLGLWKPSLDGDRNFTGFEPFCSFEIGSPAAGDRAYLVSFQRRNTGDIVPVSASPVWHEFVSAMFPNQPEVNADTDGLKESQIRMLPQYLGPMIVI